MLNYLLHSNHHGYALTYENFPLEGDTLPFSIEGAEGEGVVYLEGVACSTVKGVGAIPVAALHQGSNTLTYVENKQRYQLDPLQRCGNMVYVKPMKTGELLSLFLSFAHTTASTLSQMENRLQSTEQQIAGYPLFRQ